MTGNNPKNNNTIRAATKKKNKKVAKRAAPPDGRDHAMIWLRYPGDADDVATIKNYLTSNDPDMPGRPNYGDYKEVKAQSWDGNGGGDWVVLFFVPNMKLCHIADLKGMTLEVADAYGIYSNNMHGPPPEPDDDDSNDSDDSSTKRSNIQRRDVFEISTPFWELSQIEVGPGEKWDAEWRPGRENSRDVGHDMYYAADESFGAGQTIFVLEDDFWDQNPEFSDDFFINGEPFSRPAIRRLPEFDWGGDQFNAPPSVSHGTPVISKVTGWQLGMAKRADVIVVTDRRSPPADGYNQIHERHIEGWIRVYNEVKRIYAADPSQRGKVIASWSYVNTRATHFAVIRPIFVRRLCKCYPLFPSSTFSCQSHHGLNADGLQLNRRDSQSPRGPGCDHHHDRPQQSCRAGRRLHRPPAPLCRPRIRGRENDREHGGRRRRRRHGTARRAQSVRRLAGHGPGIPAVSG
ncbi:hypothetical protein N657DRAFT_148253 [Parathielavia appendiculata]|uniref:Uncharacterized protein n=1 Tax=Parathielavia appendiculata TaxID=2587402 RepID=A0AAN6TUE5_9PEZI|nr:hypothetical protein N657DRAFT_148253 [Parathielavia appendiculata]